MSGSLGLRSPTLAWFLGHLSCWRNLEAARCRLDIFRLVRGWWFLCYKFPHSFIFSERLHFIHVSGALQNIISIAMKGASQIVKLDRADLINLFDKSRYFMWLPVKRLFMDMALLLVHCSLMMPVCRGS